MVEKRLMYLAVLAMAAMLVLAPSAIAQEKLNCTDLLSAGSAKDIQQEAQALLNQNPNGPAQNLDANGNGIACEYTVSVQSGTQFEDGSGFISGAGAAPSAGGSGGQYDNSGSASGGGNTGGGITGGTLPDTGGAYLFTFSAGVLLLGGGLLARRVIR